MKLIKEAYGESNELDNFVYLSQKRFDKYYKVTLARAQNSDLEYNYSDRYFYSEEAARDYYSKILEDIQSDKEYYEYARLTLSEVTLNPEEEELEEFDSIEEFDDEFDSSYQVDSEEEIIDEEE